MRRLRLNKMCDCYSQIPRYCDVHKELTYNYSNISESGLEEKIGYVSKSDREYKINGANNYLITS
jgi:hypothetical protein